MNLHILGPYTTQIYKFIFCRLLQFFFSSEEDNIINVEIESHPAIDLPIWL